MSKQFITAIAALFVLIGADIGQAVTIALSSPDDLTTLQVGDTVTINVEVVDLGGFVEINTLLAETLVPSDLFAPPSAAQPGSSVPDATGFAPTLSAARPQHLTSSVVSMTTLWVCYPPITLADVFYSVNLTVVGAGTGTIGIEPLTSFALATDPTGLPVQIAPPLPVGTAGLTVNVSSIIIPEPLTATLGVLGIGALVGLSTGRRAM